MENKYIEFFKKNAIYFVIAAVIGLILFFSFEFLLDRAHRIYFEKRYNERMAEDQKFDNRVKELLAENTVLRLENEANAAARAAEDETLTRQEKEDALAVTERLKEKKKEIENTPADKQLPALCAETEIDWDFCKGL